MRYEPDDYNNEERPMERIEWCQKFSKLGGSMVDVVYIVENGVNLHLTRRFGRARRGPRCRQIRPTQKDRLKFIFGSCSWS